MPIPAKDAIVCCDVSSVSALRRDHIFRLLIYLWRTGPGRVAANHGGRLARVVDATRRCEAKICGIAFLVSECTTSQLISSPNDVVYITYISWLQSELHQNYNKRD